MVIHGSISFLGGSDKALHTDRASIECYDPLIEKWSFVAEMEKGRSGLVVVSLDHYLYVIGGRSRCLDQYYDWVERYEKPSKQSFTNVPYLYGLLIFSTALHATVP